jgi:hypothetical protein
MVAMENLWSIARDWEHEHAELMFGLGMLQQRAKTLGPEEWTPVDIALFDALAEKFHDLRAQQGLKRRNHGFLDLAS